MNLEEKIRAVKLSYPGLDLDRHLEIWRRKNPSINIEALLDQGLSSSFPFFILRVGYTCNACCVHCFVEDKKPAGDLSFDQLKLIIDSIPESSSVVITGGEPTIRSDLLDILKYIKTNHSRLIDIQTNGIKFQDRGYLEKLEPYFDSVLLPVHSCNPSIFDMITDTPGSAEAVCHALKNLSRSTILVATQTVLNTFNYPELLDTLDYIQSIIPGCRMSITFPHAVGAAKSLNVVPRFFEIKAALQVALKKYAYLINTHYIPKCLIYPYQTITNVIDDKDDGNYSKPGIDYLDQTWSSVDYGAYSGMKLLQNQMMDIREGRIKIPTCTLCRFDSECIGIMKEYSYLYSNLAADLIPVKPH